MPSPRVIGVPDVDTVRGIVSVLCRISRPLMDIGTTVVEVSVVVMAALLLHQRRHRWVKCTAVGVEVQVDVILNLIITETVIVVNVIVLLHHRREEEGAQVGGIPTEIAIEITIEITTVITTVITVDDLEVTVLEAGIVREKAAVVQETVEIILETGTAIGTIGMVTEIDLCRDLDLEIAEAVEDETVMIATEIESAEVVVVAAAA